MNATQASVAIGLIRKGAPESSPRFRYPSVHIVSHSRGEGGGAVWVSIVFLLEIPPYFLTGLTD